MSLPSDSLWGLLSTSLLSTFSLIFYYKWQNLIINTYIHTQTQLEYNSVNIPKLSTQPE